VIAGVDEPAAGVLGALRPFGASEDAKSVQGEFHWLACQPSAKSFKLGLPRQLPEELLGVGMEIFHHSVGTLLTLQAQGIK
jgi:hypothetical protein